MNTNYKFLALAFCFLLQVAVFDFKANAQACTPTAITLSGGYTSGECVFDGALKVTVTGGFSLILPDQVEFKVNAGLWNSSWTRNGNVYTSPAMYETGNYIVYMRAHCADAPAVWMEVQASVNINLKNSTGPLSAFAGTPSATSSCTCSTTVEITCSGGKAPYTITPVNPNGVSSPQTISTSKTTFSICYGTTTFNVVDACGQGASTSAYVTYANTLSVTRVVNQQTMSCSPTGIIRVNFTNPQGQRNVTIQSAPAGYTGSTTFTSSSAYLDIPNCPVGTYNIRVTDNCGVADNGSVAMTALASGQDVGPPGTELIAYGVAGSCNMIRIGGSAATGDWAGFWNSSTSYQWRYIIDGNTSGWMNWNGKSTSPNNPAPLPDKYKDFCDRGGTVEIEIRPIKAGCEDEIGGPYPVNLNTYICNPTATHTTSYPNCGGQLTVNLSYYAFCYPVTVNVHRDSPFYDYTSPETNSSSYVLPQDFANGTYTVTVIDSDGNEYIITSNWVATIPTVTTNLTFTSGSSGTSNSQPCIQESLTINFIGGIKNNNLEIYYVSGPHNLTQINVGQTKTISTSMLTPATTTGSWLVHTGGLTSTQPYGFRFRECGSQGTWSSTIYYYHSSSPHSYPAFTYSGWNTSSICNAVIITPTSRIVSNSGAAATTYYYSIDPEGHYMHLSGSPWTAGAAAPQLTLPALNYPYQIVASLMAPQYVTHQWPIQVITCGSGYIPVPPTEVIFEGLTFEPGGGRVGYVCPEDGDLGDVDNVGHIWVEASNGKPNYTYEIWDKMPYIGGTLNPEANMITSRSNRPGGEWFHNVGKADSTYYIVIRDACPNRFYTTPVTMLNLKTQQIVYTENSGFVCHNQPISLNALALGIPYGYNWRDPHGALLDGFPEAHSRTPRPIGYYPSSTGEWSVTVKAPECEVEKTDYLEITMQPLVDPALPEVPNQTLNLCYDTGSANIVMLSGATAITNFGLEWYDDEFSTTPITPPTSYPTAPGPPKDFWVLQRQLVSGSVGFDCETGISGRVRVTVNIVNDPAEKPHAVPPNICKYGQATLLPNHVGGTWYNDSPYWATLTGNIVTALHLEGQARFYYVPPEGEGCVDLSPVVVNITEDNSTVNVYYGTPSETYTFNNSLPAVQAILDGHGNFEGGTYSASAGLSINTTTGEIYPNKSVVGGPYSVFYDRSGTDGCGAMDAVTIYITEAYIPDDGVFQIWNWDDLAHVPYVQKKYDTDPSNPVIYKLMQDIGIPGKTETYGNGAALATAPLTLKNRYSGDRRFGWYGYESFVGLDQTTSYDSYTTHVSEPHYLLKDWDSNPINGWDDNGWISVGTQAASFEGEFDGNGKTATGVWINRPDSDFQGVFGYIQQAHIHDFGVSITDESGNGTIVAKRYIGGLVGQATADVTIERCFVSGSISGGDQSVGGLVGYSDGITVSECYTNCLVTGTGALVGGLVANARNAEVSYCYATGNVSASSQVGGLIGNARNANILQCYATGTVKATTGAVGGLVGTATNNSTIDSCFAFNPELIAPTVAAAGRIVGSNEAGCTLLGNHGLTHMIVKGSEFSGVAAGNNNNGANVLGCSAVKEYNEVFRIEEGGAWSNFDDHWKRTLAYSGYKVTPATNLPILNAFSMVDFSNALQCPSTDCPPCDGALIGSIKVLTQPTCNEATLGSISLDMMATSGLYSIYLNDELKYNNYSNNSITFSGLKAGNYTITIINNKTLCADAKTIALVSKDATTVGVKVETTPAASCGGEGTMTFTLLGTYEMEYTYSIDSIGGDNFYEELVPQTDNPFTVTNIPVGDYVLALKDITGCDVPVGKFAVGVGTGFQPIFTALPIPGDCIDGGSIRIELVGGLANPDDIAYYRINGSAWEPFPLGEISIPVVPGTHTIELMNQEKDCISDLRYVTVENSELSDIHVVLKGTLPTTCGENATGVIILEVSEPGIYTYKLNATTTGTFTTTAVDETVLISGVAAGSYNVIIEYGDWDMPCPYEFTIFGVQVYQGLSTPVVAGSITVDQQPTCGNNDGSIHIAATGAVSYDYSVSNGGPTGTLPTGGGVIGGLEAGYYTVTLWATGNEGCGDVSYPIALVNSDANTVIAKIKTTDATNCDTKGTVTFTVVGHKPYFYRIEKIRHDGTVEVVVPTEETVLSTITEELASGDYRLYIKDANGCENPGGMFTINATNSGMTITTTTTLNATCTGGYGKFTIAATGGATQYRLNGGGEWKSIPAEVAVPMGVHSVEVRNASGCISLPKKVEIGNGGGSSLKATVLSTTATSCGEATGTITLDVSGNNGDVYYSLDGGNTFFTTPLEAPYRITEVQAGVYDVIVKDDNCFVKAFKAEILQGIKVPVVAGSITINELPSCKKPGEGSIKVVATGASDYEYSFDGGVNYYPLADDGIIGGLDAELYTVTIRATGSSCGDVSYTIPLVNIDAIAVVDSIATLSAGDCGGNGSVTFKVVIGRKPYFAYKIIKVADGSEVVYRTNVTTAINTEALSSGDYKLYIIDANDCINPGGAFTINARSSGMNITWTKLSDASCTGDYGRVTIAATGSATHYRLNGGGAWNPITAEEIMLPAGKYTVEVKNASGCVSDTILRTIGNGAASTLAASVLETASASCGTANGTITLEVTGVNGDLYYSMDGGNTYSEYPLEAPYIIEEVQAGIFDILLKDDNCFVYAYHAEVHQGFNSGTAPPSAVTPQTFCENAQVKNLQAKGANIVWYDINDDQMEPDDYLDNGIYYVVQKNADGCEGDQTAVKVIIDNEVFIDGPSIPNEIELCLPATLADVPTNGNTNIRWYDQAAYGNEVDPTTIEFEADSVYYFYAGLLGGGDCVSAQRTEVIITIVDEIGAPVMETPQHFCEGALIADLRTPNNQILWYKDPVGGDPLDPGENLDVEISVYYAAQKAGGCETITRVPVNVFIDQHDAPVAPPLQTTCGLPKYLSDLMVIGAGIKWYEDEDGDIEIPSPSTTPAVPGNTYYIAQTVGDDCVSDLTAIKVTAECYSPYGTIFPFVHTEDAVFNSQFVITAKLYVAPPAGTLDKIGYIRKQGAVKEVMGEYYDCNTDPVILGAPRNPGSMGTTSNPGLLINWNYIGITSPGIPGNAKLTVLDKCPSANLGRYTFNNVAPGTYVLEIVCQGFLTRYGVITITGDNYLGHRELLAGDVNGDLVVNAKDLSATSPKMGAYGTSKYAWKYDFDGDKYTNELDIQIIQIDLNAYITIYEETDQWINH